MERIYRTIAGLACIAAFAFPESAAAMRWDWVPRVLKFENPYRGLDATRYPGFECKLRNAFGDCVAYSYVTGNQADNHPGGGTPKNYYRRVSSYGWSPLNYSDCQLDDYRRGTSPRMRYQLCDYGNPHSFKAENQTTTK